MSGEEVREWEPHVRAVRGMLSPETGIVDYTQVADKMAALIAQRGAEVADGRGGRAASGATAASSRVETRRRAGRHRATSSTARVCTPTAWRR